MPVFFLKFNFLKKHVNKGDEFVIETKNIFRTCGSCQREFIMLEEYLKKKGKKVKITVYSDPTIKGTRDLLNKLKIKNMDIKYMKEVYNNSSLNGFRNESMTNSEIESLEKKYNLGREFPKAFREFLFLAGNFNCYHFDDLGEGLDELQNILQEDMDYIGQKIDKPYFAFDVLDRMYSVILLDEDAEDPLIYLLDPYGFLDGDTPLLKPNDWNFTALVNESIRRVKNNLPM